MANVRGAHSSKRFVKQPLICFVAMRIGDPDTDAVYRTLIRRTLRQLHLTPRRSDKVVHNQRVDQWIEKEVDKCDLMVADLTFARPSVYWEAGRAEARVPVVYTCRRDHFRPRPDDENGNYRIHFDLHTKNIIDWSSPTDQGFARRLKSRLRHVTAPLVAIRAKENLGRAQAAEFARLSMQARCRRLIEVALAAGKAVGLRPMVSKRDRDAMLPAIQGTPLEAQWQFAGHTRASIQTVFVTVLDKGPSVTELRKASWRSPYDPLGNTGRWRQGKALDDHVVILTLGKLVARSLDRALPDFTPAHENGAHVWARSFAPFQYAGHHVPARTVSVHLIANVLSESDGRQRLSAVFARIRGPR